MTGPRLTTQLLAWILGALVLLWSSFIYTAYRTGEHEADELTDGHLAGVAALLVNLRSGSFAPSAVDRTPEGAHEMKAHDYQQSMTVAVWEANGTLMTRVGEGPTPEFSESEGFSTVALGEPAAPWRVFSRWDPTHQRKVTVLLSLHERDALAKDIAEQTIVPGLWLLPVLALALIVAVRRGLRPLYQLSSEVHSLDVASSPSLPARGRHQEFQTVVDAINALLIRYQASVGRERALADELAHELRTPLTSMALQLEALRSCDDESERRSGLTRLHAATLRAGEVISHLLALARASRAQVEQSLVPVDLSELARSTVAEFAQTAYSSGHELSFQTSGPMPVRGHPALLDMALRNLIDNALRHTPTGTEVEVQVLPDLSVVRVCDGSPSGRVPRKMPDQSHEQRPAGLGLGHRVVRKVADLHGAGFEAVTPPPAGWSSCYELRFAPPPGPKPAGLAGSGVT